MGFVCGQPRIEGASPGSPPVHLDDVLSSPQVAGLARPAAFGEAVTRTTYRSLRHCLVRGLRCQGSARPRPRSMLSPPAALTPAARFGRNRQPLWLRKACRGCTKACCLTC